MVNGQLSATTALPLKEKSPILIDNIAQFLGKKSSGGGVWRNDRLVKLFSLLPQPHSNLDLSQWPLGQSITLPQHDKQKYKYRSTGPSSIRTRKPSVSRITALSSLNNEDHLIENIATLLQRPIHENNPCLF